MKPDVHVVRELLAAHDPHPSSAEDLGAGSKSEATLHRLLTAPATSRLPVAPSQRARRWAPILATATGALAILVLVAGSLLFGMPSRTRAYAATPSPLQLPSGAGEPAKPALLRLAEIADAQPGPPPAGRYHYVKLRAWYLNTAVDGESVRSQLQPQVVEKWVADDGASRVVTVRDGNTDVVSSGPTGSSLSLANRLSTDPQLLARQLPGYPQTGRDNAGIPNRVERVERAVDVLRDYGTVSPALQAALWRVLADQRLINHGTIVDRGGRRGLAFSIDSNHSGLPTRYLLIIDPKTGRLLSFEQVLTKRAGKLNVRIPSVTSYEIFVSAGRVATDTTRPTR